MCKCQHATTEHNLRQPDAAKPPSCPAPRPTELKSRHCSAACQQSTQQAAGKALTRRPRNPRFVQLPCPADKVSTAPTHRLNNNQPAAHP
jgi:hypothetical protein